jgi:hypothetical protein
MPAINARIIGAKQIEQALINAFEDWTKEEINEKHWDSQFGDRKWDYEAVTLRKNRETVGPSPRDIYDLGELYESGIKSYKFTAGTSSAEASWHWDAKNKGKIPEEYAWYIHEGEGTNIQARKFTDQVSDAKFSFMNDVGLNLLDRVQAALNGLHAN